MATGWMGDVEQTRGRTGHWTGATARLPDTLRERMRQRLSGNRTRGPRGTGGLPFAGP